MKTFQLVPHPDFPTRGVHEIGVEAARISAVSLELTFIVEGTIGEVELPELADRRFVDGLWQHTCFEAFVIPAQGAGYLELNVAPSMEWAAYSFSWYRDGMVRLLELDPVTAAGWQSDQLRLSVCIDLPMLAAAPVWNLGLSAIIQAKDGTKSYWALAHAPGPPDFHNRDCFTARLPAPTGP